MAFNLADFIEHTVDAVPDRTALICGDRDGDLRRARGAGQPPRPPPRRPGRRPWRPRGGVLVQQHRVRRDDARGLQAAGRPDQRELPLRRGRARLPPRQQRRRRPRVPGAVLAAGGCRADRAAAPAPRHRDRRRHRHRPAGRRRRRTSGAWPTSSPDARLRAALRRRPLHPLHGRHDRATRRASCGATRTCGACWAAASTSRPACAIEDEHQMSRLAKEGEPSVGLVLAPLMHGAAQWGTLGGLIRGSTSVLLPQFDGHAVWRAVEQYRIATLAITGDAMARPLIEALQEQRLRHVVAGRHQLDGGGVLPGREGPALRAAAEPVHQRGRGLVRERVQRHAAGGEGQHRQRRPASSTSRVGPTRS